MAQSYTIRDAIPSDSESIVTFTLREAQEAEGVELSDVAVRRGVQAAFTSEPLAKYWIAENSGQVVASVSIVKEWSNFHGAFYWWIQSVFIVPEHRGTGLIEQLMEHVAHAATATGAVDLRLYAHTSNERALAAYRRCGFTPAPYALLTRRL